MEMKEMVVNEKKRNLKFLYEYPQKKWHNNVSNDYKAMFCSINTITYP